MNASETVIIKKNERVERDRQIESRWNVAPQRVFRSYYH